ncbi:acylphosphatase [Virgibacillus sp. MSJ-26]|uniref:acylphosphatase n=1 Tax=Virgibacillus sp. MSJ-26 TaxID=2841522 RepID=UPI001C1008B7|nr:acylphosphatase [Virgibacillus sp. MSJ-26]MBU5466646.1 acylphosphatase [Virgibacillus sp. MSJ-26]
MHFHLIISGHVQGVGFRYSAQQKANEYNLYGWVMNLEDGTVEMEVEGPENQVNQYVTEIKNGFHRFIRVDDINIEKTEGEKGYKQFTIK